MEKVLTSASTVHCGHDGAIALVTNPALKVKGSAVVTKVGSTVNPSCKTQNSNSSKKCTTASPSGGVSSKLKVGGSPVILETVGGNTDGNPKGTVTASANQSKLKAK